MADDAPDGEPVAEATVVDKPREEPEPAGVGGEEPLEALSWVLVAAGLMLLLPRQWASAGIAFLLAFGLRMASKRRSRAKLSKEKSAEPVEA